MKPKFKFLLCTALSTLFILPSLTTSAMFGVDRESARDRTKPLTHPYKTPSSFLYEKSLHKAIVSPGTYENVYLLIRQNPDLINQIDVVGNTPLHIAVGCVRLEIVKLLLDNGADITLKTPAKKTALDTAKSLKENVTEQLAKEHDNPSNKNTLLKKASTLDKIIRLLESHSFEESID